MAQLYERENGTHVITIGSSGTSGNNLQERTISLSAGVSCTADRSLHVADNNKHRVQVFRQDTHAFVGQFGSEVTGDGQFQYPIGVCLGSDGLVYVTDSFNHKVQVFRHDSGLFVAVLGGEVAGAGVGQLNEPRGICCSKDGVLYVADTYNHRLHTSPLVQLQQQREESSDIIRRYVLCPGVSSFCAGGVCVAFCVRVCVVRLAVSLFLRVW